MPRSLSLRAASCAALAATTLACARKPIAIPLPSDESIRAEFEKTAPARRGDSTSWVPELTVPFPASWPPKDPPEVVYYGYGWTIGGVSDGRRECTVWGEFHARLDATGAFRFDRIGTGVKAAGIQGVWPRTKPAPDWDAARAELGDVLAGRLAPERTKALKPAYCDWRATSGVADEQIKDRQRDFFAWLDCPK